MKKKTLVILLIIPFIIGLLSFVSVVLLNITSASNISAIKTPYNTDGEGFKVSDTPYLLEATPVINDPNIILRDGNNLVWEIVDSESVKDIATVSSTDNETFYLNALSEGEVTLKCKTENGGVEVNIKAIIYEDGAIIITPSRSGTGTQVEDTRYFGEYDISYDEVSKDTKLTKNHAKVQLNINIYGDNISENDLELVETSSNITYENKVITINDEGDGSGYLTLRANYISSTYTFNIVNNGVNVYNYNDLLMCTNFSSSGEIVVLQTSLGSLKEVYKGNDVPISGSVGEEQGAYKYEVSLPLERLDPSENIELFGNYDVSNDSFNFNNELYYTETTYNHKYLDDWNKAHPDSEVSTDIKVGIRVQKDFYGNGFNINMNNLCFPNNGTISQDVLKLAPSEKDYFFGPLAYVTIGAPNVFPSVVKAYGEDNAGLMIDGDNITVNDLKIQNIDDNSNKRNYAYIGTVIEVNGENNTIKNSIIRLGKTLVRAFDSDNLLIDNCILSRSGEFSLKIGSNEEIKADQTKEINYEYDGQDYSFNFDEFFSISNSGLGANSLLEEYLGLEDTGINLPSNVLYDMLRTLQDALNNTTNIVNNDGTINYASEVTVNNTSFEDSGLFSIAFETRFNGPFLFNGLSSSIQSVLSALNSPTPDNIGGTSLPVKLNLTGDTYFYDYKNINNIDVTNLIEENISTYLSGVIGEDVNVTIDNFFPMRPILIDRATELDYIYQDDKNDKYLNTMIAYYGGGLNLSTLDTSNLNENSLETMSEEINVDLLSESDKYVSSNRIAQILSRCVLFAAGFEPFKFITNGKVNNDVPPLFGEHPTVNTLKENLTK
ncbi:MAG: hypothetical protein IAC58_01545 [Firmicutes bacterium]|uniref:Uncharacterized protein n=1 Tax=Candidatus Onthovivens merdipullorum TaxID=2840889 RepID=A0A9D9DI10_9BACL|nr:hypothetical protein [Candidatus Onthovivens merdipullorum]